MTRQIQLTLIGKSGCHLCDDARLAVERVLSGFRQAHPAVEISVTEIDMMNDPALIAKYAEEVPVLLINGKQHSYWTIDDSRLRASLDALADT